LTLRIYMVGLNHEEKQSHTGRDSGRRPKDRKAAVSTEGPAAHPSDRAAGEWGGGTKAEGRGQTPGRDGDGTALGTVQERELIMATVYKRTDKRTGKPRPEYYFKFKDANGRWVERKGWNSLKKTRAEACALESDHRAVANGDKAAPPSWLKNRRKSITEVIESYLSWGRTSGGRYGRPWDDQNAALKEANLDYWVRELGLATLGDIQLHRVEPVISEMLKTKAPKTVYRYAEALRSLCLWSIRRGLLGENPLAGMAKLDQRARVPHRVLTDEEVGELLTVAPAERRLWYETALGTGFRVGELRSLKVKDLDLFGPSIFLAADNSKDRKDHRQPITRTLADRLKVLAEGRDGEESLLSIPKAGAHKDNRYDPAGLLAKDYEKAKIVRETPEGKATWHSLRKVYINNVVKAGCDLKTIMTLARHSTAQLSMETYAQPDPALLRKAAESVENRVNEAAEKAVWGTRGERKAAQGGSGPVTMESTNGLRVCGMVDQRSNC
jgi:integrase